MPEVYEQEPEAQLPALEDAPRVPIHRAGETRAEDAAPPLPVETLSDAQAVAGETLGEERAVSFSAATQPEAPTALPPGRSFPDEDSVPAEWQVGDLILDTYEVKQVIPPGGMGLVYRVHHKNWATDLAVKSPRPGFFESEEHKQNFIREAETWVSLGLHPHIVSCFYVRTLGDIPRVFAEYVKGGSLRDWIDDGRLYAGGPEAALERILDIAIQMAWGLDYAHEFEYEQDGQPHKGLVHQDVKPANVLLSPDGRTMITDFGLARARPVATVETRTETGSTVLVNRSGMTPAYASPEQMAGQPLSRRTDIWSWAVTVLEIFTGEIRRKPGSIAGHSLNDYLKQWPPDAAIPVMPAALVDLLQQCFQRHPAARPATMATIADALREMYTEVAGQDYSREQPQAAELTAASLNNKALSLYDLGKTTEAEAVWRQALQVDATHPEATYNLGLVLWRSARQDDIALVRSLEDVVTSHLGKWLPLWLLAQVHLERGDCEAALETLQQVSEGDTDHVEVAITRQIAQDLLPRSRRCLRTFEVHTGRVTSVNLSADGLNALSSEDKTLKLWNIATGECLQTFEGHTEKVLSVGLNADGWLALSGGEDKTLKLWNIATGECLRTFEGHKERVLSVGLSADGRRAVSGSKDGILKLWDTATGECLRTFDGHTGSVKSVSLSANGQLALSISSGPTLKLWDMITGECLQVFKAFLGVLSANGQFIFMVLGNWWDPEIELRDVTTGECLWKFDQLRPMFDGTSFVSLSADGRFAFSGALKTLKLWDMATGMCLRTLEGHAYPVISVSCSADGRFALSGSADGTLKLWNVDYIYHAPLVASRVITTLESAKLDTMLAKAAAALDTRQTHVAWDTLTQLRTENEMPSSRVLALWRRLALLTKRGNWRGSRLAAIFRGHTGYLASVSLSADGHLALSGSQDKTLKLWNTETGICLRTLEGLTEYWPIVCLSANGRFALAVDSDRILRLWDAIAGQCLQMFEGHTEKVTSVYLSANGHLALSGSKDLTFKLWHTATGNCLRTFASNNWIHSVCLSVDERFVLSGEAGLKLWDVTTGKCLRKFGETRVLSATLSADGRFALSGNFDNTLKLWDVVTGNCLRTFEGHTESVKSVSLSTDGRVALSGCEHRTLKLWDVVTGECLQTLAGAMTVHNTVISADGWLTLSVGDNTKLNLWALDWDLEYTDPADWDEGARPHLQNFLTLHTPYAGVLPQDREPTEEEITLALTRRGKPAWTEEDFEQLLYTLGCAGYGWLRPTGVRRELEKMAENWDGPPPLFTDEAAKRK